MNIPTIIISLIVLGLLALAVRYLVKNGMCAACEDKEACQAAKKAGGSSLPATCGGNCSACRYQEYELKAAAKRPAGE